MSWAHVVLLPISMACCCAAACPDTHQQDYYRVLPLDSDDIWTGSQSHFKWTRITECGWIPIQVLRALKNTTGMRLLLVAL